MKRRLADRTILNTGADVQRGRTFFNGATGFGAVAAGVPIRACRLLAAETPQRESLPEVLQRLEAAFGPKMDPRGSQLTVRFGDPRSAWERLSAPEAERWCFAPADAKGWWKAIIEGPARDAGGGGPRSPPDQVRKASFLVVDDPALPTPVVVAEIHFGPPGGASLDRRELYMAKWSLQQWLRVFVWGGTTPTFFAPVSVGHFALDLPSGYPAIVEKLRFVENLMENTPRGPESDSNEVRALFAAVSEALPFGMGDSRNERCSHFLGYSNAHLSMGDWGFMTGPGQRSWLVQEFHDPKDPPDIFAMHSSPQSMLHLQLQMPGSQVHSEPDEFLFPLLAERWALAWIIRARELELGIGAVIDQLADAETQDVVQIMQKDAPKLLASNAELRYARQVVHRRAMPGVRRLVGPRRGFRTEVPGRGVESYARGELLQEQRALYKLGRSVEDLLLECEEVQNRLDDDLAAATTALATVAQVELAATQARAASAMTWLTWAMLALALITTAAAVAALAR